MKWLSIFIEYLDTPFVLEKIEDRRKDRKINLALLMIVVICSIFRKLNLFPTEEYELPFAFLFHKWQILTYLWILFFCKFGNIHNYLDFFQTNTSWGFCWWSLIQYNLLRLLLSSDAKYEFPNTKKNLSRFWKSRIFLLSRSKIIGNRLRIRVFFEFLKHLSRIHLEMTFEARCRYELIGLLIIKLLLVVCIS